MTKPAKKQSNPFSTGGGPTFESRVQAAFTVLMMTGRIAPCLDPWPIMKLKEFRFVDAVWSSLERMGG